MFMKFKRRIDVLVDWKKMSAMLNIVKDVSFLPQGVMKIRSKNNNNNNAAYFFLVIVLIYTQP